MQISRRSRKSVKIGYALVIVLVFLAAALLTYASLLAWVSSNAKITKRNNLYNQSEAAAEAATENVLASMIRDFDNQSLNSASSYAAMVPTVTSWPIKFAFADSTGLSNKTSVSVGPTNWTTLPYPYTGLYGLGQNCTVASTATPLNQGVTLSATASQGIWFGVIPMFQYAIFYNLDLEINPGATMTVNGKAHSNANIYATGASSGSPLTFSDVVEAVTKVYQHCGPNDPQNTSRNGNVIFLDTTNNPLSGASALTLPIGTNNNPALAEGVLNLPPAGSGAPASAAYSLIGQSYTFNEADLVISNSATGLAGSGNTNISVYYQDPYNASALTKLSPDIVFTNGVGVVTNSFFSWVTNVTFYDFREFCKVQAVQIDVSKLRNWITNTTTTGGNTYNNKNISDKGHWINGVYVYNKVPLIGGNSTTTGQLPAVRLVNGSRLPSGGLSVATPQALYVMGNYNVTTNGVKSSLTLGSAVSNTVPAGLMGDAITIMTTNWNDTAAAYLKGGSLSSRGAADTTINAATLEGIVPSQLDAGGNKHYSGGVENFLRLLENWSTGHSGGGSAVLTYNGSIIVLFPSIYATNFWLSTGNYYNAPNRSWGFDLSFTNQSHLPPMTPQVRAVLRQSWQ
jgi:hypothetical protein